MKGFKPDIPTARAGLAAGMQNKFATCSIVRNCNRGFRRRGSVPSAHVPWKILIPHNTTTMTDTSVAAVNTLSKEATLMTLSASYPA